MEKNEPSRTALTTSLIRAHHTRTHHSPLISDPWGDLLNPQSFREMILQWVSQDRLQADRDDQPQEVLDEYLSRLASYASVIFRARYAEDALAAAVARGVEQYVQIGAGFDSYALRRPSNASHVVVFEVDHPATQDLKLQRFATLGLNVPERVEFVPADLASKSIDDALGRSRFQFDKPAIFSWLGVTIYLTRAANLASLKAIADCCVPGSAVVFTYTDELALIPGSQSAAYERMKRNAAAMGEPFLSGFQPNQLAATLAGVGFALSEDLNGLQLSERYACPAVPPLVPSALSRAALAYVGPRALMRGVRGMELPKERHLKSSKMRGICRCQRRNSGLATPQSNTSLTATHAH